MIGAPPLPLGPIYTQQILLLAKLCQSNFVTSRAPPVKFPFLLRMYTSERRSIAWFPDYSLFGMDNKHKVNIILNCITSISSYSVYWKIINSGISKYYSLFIFLNVTFQNAFGRNRTPKSEYLNILQARQMWFFKTPDVSIGGVSHVLGEHSLRNDWSLGTITKLITTHDGEVRSVELMLGSGGGPGGRPRELVRPVSKIVRLIKASNL